MKTFVRTSAIHGLSLSLVSSILPGLSLDHGFITIFLSGVILTILYSILRPIFGILLLPLNFLTFGSLSFLIHAIIFYLLTVFVPQVSVSAFTFYGLKFAGFVIPKAEFNLLFAFIVISCVFSFTVAIIEWLIK